MMDFRMLKTHLSYSRVKIVYFEHVLKEDEGTLQICMLITLI